MTKLKPWRRPHLTNQSKLRDWRREKRMKQAKLAERLGVSIGTVCRIEACQQWPTPEVLTDIERITKGAVTVSDVAADFTQTRQAAE